jgi:hypothetical protein
MPKSFNYKTPAGIARITLFALLACNLVALYFVLRPVGGSPQELDQQLTDLRGQVLQKSLLLKQTRANVQKIELGRNEGDQFMTSYFLSERSASSTLIDELSRAAKDAKITPKEHSVQTEDIEGSDNLKMMTINGNYEGTYADLIEFINRLDRSRRLLIIESLNATPQQGKGMLNINVKMDTLVREDAAGQ